MHWVETDTSVENRRRFEQRNPAGNGGVLCPAWISSNCAAPVYQDRDLARHVPDAAFALYSEAKLSIAEQRNVVRMERDFQERLEAENRRIAQMTAEDERARAVRNHIVENILCLRCPRCSAVFQDFDGCCALSCGRVGCSMPPYGFCAYCLHDANGDCHGHVGSCEFNITNPRTVYARWDVYEEAQKRRRERMVREYLATLNASSRTRAISDCAQDFADLDMAIQWE